MGLDLKEAHAEIARRLDRLDFGALLPGFRRYRFALYDDCRVCLGGDCLPADARFLGNTAIEYDGQQIAIWRLSGPPANYDSLAALLAHEMCHAFQVETCAVFPDEIVGAFYPRDLTNSTGKHMENLLLAELLAEYDPGKWERLVRLRAARLKAGPQAVGYEIKAEGIEGQAKFVEFAALKLLSPALYDETLDKTTRSLRDPRAVFNARLCCYDSGAALLAVATANGLPTPDWTAEALKAGEAGLTACPDLSVEYRQYYHVVDALVNGSLAKAEKIELSGNVLLGFDPYNVRSSGNNLYHPSFIMCGEKNTKPAFFTGTYITAMKGPTKDIEAIYKVKQ